MRPLSLYYVDPKQDTHLPIDVTLESPQTMRVESVGPDPQVVVSATHAVDGIQHDDPGTRDRFGRRPAVPIRVRDPGPIWIVTPGSVRRVSP